jgi:hypothetical protein
VTTLLRIYRVPCAVAVLAGLVSADPARAQDQTPAEPTPMTVHGSVDVGYRNQDVNGNADTFRQLFDVSDGVRLFGVDVRATGGTAPSRAFDTLTFNAQGIGGDPFPSVVARARRSKVYDVRVSWRRIRFFDVAPLTPASIDGFDTRAVTDRHSWSTSRRLGNVSATVNATTRLQILFGYDRTSRDGAIGSTRSVDFIGSPTTWGAFARANPYPVSGPVDDSSNRVSGGASYSWDRVTLHYKAGYQTSEETMKFDPLAVPERSINVGDPTTAAELLSTVGWSQQRKLKMPSSELSFVARPASSIEWRGEYLYYRARGPFSLDAAFGGRARTSSASVTSPYNVIVSADGTGTTPNHILGQGFTYRRSVHWGVDVDYRYSRMDSESTGDLVSVLSNYAGAAAPVTTRESDDLSWRQTLHTIRAALLWQPVPGLTLRPGVRFSQRDVVMKEDGIVNAPTTRDDNTTTPEISVGYRPSRWLDLRAVVRHVSNDSPYTRMSPSDRDIARVIATVEPVEGLTITAAADRNTAKLTTASFESRIRGGSVHAAYAFDERVTAFGSFDYRNLLALGDTTFLRGTAPITDVVMRDREIDYIWQGGATVRVLPRLEVTATGIYDRTSGTDSITGEPPLYGPVSFPFGTLSASYDVPRAGKISIDIQRTHMFQDLLPLNDFRATMVTVRFTRGF